MHPVLINLGPIPIHTYGLMIAIGFLACIQVVKRLAVYSKINVDRFLDLTFWCLVVGLLGTRILFIITRLPSFIADPLAMFKIWEGGLVFFGGPIAVIPFFIWYCKKYKMPMWKAFDVAACALTIAHAFGRIGCLAAGCCYGKPTGTSFGIKLYSDLVDRQYHGIPLHPTQIYESFSLFVLFSGLIFLFKRKTFDGQVMLTYLVTYPIIRSIIETFRGDLIRGFIIEDVLSTSQFISLLVFIAAGIALFVRLNQLKAEPAKKKALK